MLSLNSIKDKVRLTENNIPFLILMVVTVFLISLSIAVGVIRDHVNFSGFATNYLKICICLVGAWTFYGCTARKTAALPKSYEAIYAIYYQPIAIYIMIAYLLWAIMGYAGIFYSEYSTLISSLSIANNISLFLALIHVRTESIHPFIDKIQDRFFLGSPHARVWQICKISVCYVFIIVILDNLMSKNGNFLTAIDGLTSLLIIILSAYVTCMLAIDSGYKHFCLIFIGYFFLIFFRNVSIFSGSNIAKINDELSLISTALGIGVWLIIISLLTQKGIDSDIRDGAEE